VLTNSGFERSRLCLTRVCQCAWRHAESRVECHVPWTQSPPIVANQWLLLLLQAFALKQACDCPTACWFRSHSVRHDAPACRTPDGKIADVLPGKDSGFNARTRVHEYGGGESIVGDGVVYWSNFKCALPAADEHPVPSLCLS